MRAFPPHYNSTGEEAMFMRCQNVYYTFNNEQSRPSGSHVTMGEERYLFAQCDVLYYLGMALQILNSIAKRCHENAKHQVQVFCFLSNVVFLPL